MSELFFKIVDAIKQGSCETNYVICESLLRLKKGNNIDEFDQNGTLLYYAVFYRRTRFGQFLLCQGANPRISVGDNLSPLNLAQNKEFYQTDEQGKKLFKRLRLSTLPKQKFPLVIKSKVSETKYYNFKKKSFEYDNKKKVIGKGAFGQVKTFGDETDVIKVIRNNQLNPFQWYVKRVREGKLTKKLYPNTHYGFLLGDGKPTKFYMAMPRCKGISLSDFIGSKEFGQLALVKRQQLILACLFELQRVHNNEMVHFDIKPANFIVNPNTLDVCIIDFGLSHMSQNLGSDKALGGTFYHYAPEAIVGHMELTTAVDIYAMVPTILSIFVPDRKDVIYLYRDEAFVFIVEQQALRIISLLETVDVLLELIFSVKLNAVRDNVKLLQNTPDVYTKLCYSKNIIDILSFIFDKIKCSDLQAIKGIKVNFKKALGTIRKSIPPRNLIMNLEYDEYRFWINKGYPCEEIFALEQCNFIPEKIKKVWIMLLNLMQHPSPCQRANVVEVIDIVKKINQISV